MIRNRPTLSEQVDAAFQSRVTPHPEFAGALLVRRVDEGGDFGFQTHRIYRTVNGTYFLFICTAGQAGYLTPLSRDRAKNALRSSPEIFRKEFEGAPSGATDG